MPQAKPGDEGYIKKRIIEFVGKFISFGNMWAIMATVLLLWKHGETIGVITNGQWTTILMFVLGGRTLIKTVNNYNGKKK